MTPKQVYRVLILSSAVFFNVLALLFQFNFYSAKTEQESPQGTLKSKVKSYRREEPKQALAANGEEKLPSMEEMPKRTKVKAGLPYGCLNGQVEYYGYTWSLICNRA